MVDRTHRELTDGDLASIADTYHAWRGSKSTGKYEDVPGFCKSATLEEIRRHGHILTPVATLARLLRRTTASLSMRRWPGSRLNGGSSRPKPIDWIRRSRLS